MVLRVFHQRGFHGHLQLFFELRIFVIITIVLCGIRLPVRAIPRVVTFLLQAQCNRPTISCGQLMMINATTKTSLHQIFIFDVRHLEPEL
jgi:hypothetical protein